MKWIVVGALVLSYFTRIASAACSDDKHSFVVVLDLNAIDSANNQFGEPRQRVYSFPVVADESLAKDIHDRESWDSVKDRLQAHGTTGRWKAGRGGVVQVSAYGSVDQIANVEFKFGEKPRLSRLSRDVVELVRIAREIGVKAVDRDDDSDSRIWRDCHTLEHRRAELTVKAVAAKRVEEKKDSPPAKVTYWPGVFSTQVTTGPREGLFLSADVPLTKASQLKVNDAGTDLELGDEPGGFYAGIDYTLGDILSEPNGLWDRLVLKGMVLASRSPWQSYGWGVGLRSIDIPWLGIQLDTITPFIGYTYTRQDAVAGQPSQGRNSELRVGVSLNLNKAVAWAKSDD
jgi:hypothetical protein